MIHSNPATTRIARRPAMSVRKGPVHTDSVHKGLAHKGMTLTELLVVIAVLMILASMTVGSLRPGMQGMQVREGARVLNSVLSKARYRAQRNGRPAGVMFEPLASKQGDVSLNLIPVEEPRPFGGDTSGATISFADSTTENTLTTTATISAGNRSIGDLVSAGVIATGDRLQLNYRGHMFFVSGLSEGSNSITLTTTSHSPRWPSGSVPFLFHRRPRPSSSPATQMPQGSVVDLTVSGWGKQEVFTPDESTPVIVMFSPSGPVERMFSWDPSNGGKPRIAPAISAIHFLVGRIDQTPTNGTSANLGDPNNRWVSITPLTGMIRTNELSIIYPSNDRNQDPDTKPAFNASTNTTNVGLARRLIRGETSRGEAD